MVAAVRVEEVSDSAKGWDNLSTNVMYDTYLVNGAAVCSVRAQGGGMIRARYAHTGLVTGVLRLPE